MSTKTEVPDLLDEIASLLKGTHQNASRRHALLVQVARVSLGRIKGPQVRSVAEYALRLSHTANQNAIVEAGDVGRRAIERIGNASTIDEMISQHQRDSTVLTIHRPTSALMQMLSSGKYPQSGRLHRASDKQLFSAMGLMLLCEALKAPFGITREEMLIDAAECILVVAPVKTLGLGGTRAEWRNVLRSEWHRIAEVHGPNFSAKVAASFLAEQHPDIEPPARQKTFENVVSELRGEMTAMGPKAS
jgi:hypothetical protein